MCTNANNTDAMRMDGHSSHATSPTPLLSLASGLDSSVVSGPCAPGIACSPLSSIASGVNWTVVTGVIVEYDFPHDRLVEEITV